MSFICAGGFFHAVLDTELSKDHPALLVDVDGEEDHSVCPQPEVRGGGVHVCVLEKGREKNKIGYEKEETY